ncbi:MAG: hypothetical protein ACXAB4_07080 [Candidatus Hodarchaeales archaeon]|jgi:hypothetical protein
MSAKDDKCFYEMKFADKSSWNDMKSDLKALFNEIGIRYQYSGKTPQFHVIYESENVVVEVTWAEDGLYLNLRGREKPLEENLIKLSEIFDLLELFGGEIVAGSRPEEWE